MVTDVMGKVNLKLRAAPQSKPILVHVNWVKHLKQLDFHEQFDSKQRQDNSEEEGRNSSPEEEQCQCRAPSRTPRQTTRPATPPSKPTRFTLVRVQRQPAGEFREFNHKGAALG